MGEGDVDKKKNQKQKQNKKKKKQQQQRQQQHRPGRPASSCVEVLLAKTTQEVSYSVFLLLLRYYTVWQC